MFLPLSGFSMGTRRSCLFLERRAWEYIIRHRPPNVISVLPRDFDCLNESQKGEQQCMQRRSEGLRELNRRGSRTFDKSPRRLRSWLATRSTLLGLAKHKSALERSSPHLAKELPTFACDNSAAKTPLASLCRAHASFVQRFSTGDDSRSRAPMQRLDRVPSGVELSQLQPQKNDGMKCPLSPHF